MADPFGLVDPGNIDLNSRPVVRNGNGFSTVRSIGVNVDGREVLIPTVSDDGRLLSNDEAIGLFKQTGKHLGKFETPEAATSYAHTLHDDQARQYGDAFGLAPSDIDPMTGVPLTPSDYAQGKFQRIATAVGSGLKNWVETPGRAYKEGITPEEAADWGAGTAFGMLGVGTPAGMLGPSASVGAAGGKLRPFKGPPEEGMMVVHNTRPDRLAKADEIGGFAVPSVAIVKPEHGFNAFGDVSLVAPPEFVKPSRSNPVFASDVYSPRFPSLNDEGTKIFRGFTDMGNRRYAPLTLDNLVREMKGNVRGGESFNYGAGSVRAGVTPQFGSLAEIQGARDRLIPHEEFRALKDKTNQDLLDLAYEFQPHYKYSGRDFDHTNDFSSMLAEYGPYGLRRMEEHYPGAPPELYDKARSFLTGLRDMPTEYFEAKPQRGVRIGEFTGAVVPESEVANVAPILERNGIKRIETYGGESWGSPERTAALKRFPDLLFSGSNDTKQSIAGQVAQASRDQGGFGSLAPDSPTLYHGTSKDKGFKNIRDARNGTWFTTDPKEASGYAMENDSRGFRWENGRPVRTNEAARVIPVEHEFKNTLELKEWPKSVAEAENYKRAQSEYFDTLRAKGYDSVRMPTQDGQSIYVSLDNSKLRPKYSAGGRGALFSGSNDTAQSVAGEVAQATREPGSIAPIRAYHGSPHDFDRFDLSKIGTGEGAQAYGHGLYFAENEGVARSYRDALSRSDADVMGDAIRHMVGQSRAQPNASVDSIVKKNLSFRPAIAAHADNPETVSLIARAVRGHNADGTVTPDALNAFRGLSRVAGDKPTGKMYEVGINAHPDQFLDWDKPLSQQGGFATDRLAGEEIRRRLSEIGARLKVAPEAEANQLWIERGRLEPLQDRLEMLVKGRAGGLRDDVMPGRIVRTPGETEVLREAGIPGIRYLDQGSRVKVIGPELRKSLETRLRVLREDLANAEAKGVGQPDVMRSKIATLENQLIPPKETRNYVMFDDSLIDILRKYALPGAVGGGAAFGSLAPGDGQ